MRQDYCAGIAFNADRSKIVLIRKNRPAWMKGFLNGVGGKIEPNEPAKAAMVREFFEETGVQTTENDWHYYTKIIGRDGDVYFFRLFDDKILTATTKDEEEVRVYDVDFDMIRREGLSNLLWLVAIALDETLPNFFVEANYNQEFITGKTGT